MGIWLAINSALMVGALGVGVFVVSTLKAGAFMVDALMMGVLMRFMLASIWRALS